MSAKRKRAPASAIKLPRMASVLRYFDDFDEQTFAIKEPALEDLWILRFDGREETLDFAYFEVEYRILIKHWCAFMLGTELAPATVRIRFENFRRLDPVHIADLVSTAPTNVRPFWTVLFAKYATYRTLEAAKSFLRFLCESNIGSWNKDHLVLIERLRLPKVDKYASVRSGKVFLSSREQRALIRAIDRLVELVRANSTEVSDSDLERMAILIISFQFGMRRKQIGMLKMRDVRISRARNTAAFSVDLTFMMIKQRTAAKRLPMTRRVTPDWAPIFLELLARRRANGHGGEERFFTVRSSSDVGNSILATTKSVLGHARSCNELRHTMAQRFVDQGGSQHALALLMGQSVVETALVYFGSSASQAERVNEALGISKTYARVIQIARDRYISTEQLSRLKGDQQIAGVPHGIPITGIGGCSVGQPACPYNPVMSCYTCPKFMPVRTVDIHIQVLADLRKIVKWFYNASRGDTASPTYMQLRHTIAAVQAVINDLSVERS